MNPLLWGPSSWLLRLPVVNVIQIVTIRMAAEAVGVPMYSTMGVPMNLTKGVPVDSTMVVPEDPAVEATSMNPLLWGPLSWPLGSPVVNVVEIVETRATVEAVGVQMYSTMGVPASLAKVPKDPAVEATLMNLLWWGPLLWPPESPVVDVVEIVVARVAAEARPVVELTRKVPLARGVSRVARTVAREVSLARSLSFTREEALVREDSPMWLRRRSREEAAMAAKREVGVILSHR